MGWHLSPGTRGWEGESPAEARPESQRKEGTREPKRQSGRRQGGQRGRGREKEGGGAARAGGGGGAGGSGRGGGAAAPAGPDAGGPGPGWAPDSELSPLPARRSALSHLTAVRSAREFAPERGEVSSEAALLEQQHLQAPGSGPRGNRAGAGVGAGGHWRGRDDGALLGTRAGSGLWWAGTCALTFPGASPLEMREASSFFYLPYLQYSNPLPFTSVDAWREVGGGSRRGSWLWGGAGEGRPPELVSYLSFLPAPRRGTLDSRIPGSDPSWGMQRLERGRQEQSLVSAASLSGPPGCVAERRASLLRGCLLCVSLKLRDLAQAQAQAAGEVGGKLGGPGGQVRSWPEQRGWEGRSEEGLQVGCGEKEWCVCFCCCYFHRVTCSLFCPVWTSCLSACFC